MGRGRIGGHVVRRVAVGVAAGALAIAALLPGAVVAADPVSWQATVGASTKNEAVSP